jgi:ABC-type Fe3+/spermidine/putrescine transport system ATPase subunit
VRLPALEIVETEVGPLLCSFASGSVAGSQVVISVRPENIKITKEVEPGETNILEGRVKERTCYMGMVDYAIDVLGVELRVRAAVDGNEINGNGTVRLKLAADKCTAITLSEGERSDDKPVI